MQELPGQSELALLNALCIAHLRKRRHPRGTAELFHRIWAEQGARLVTELPMRWLISTIITFGDHGLTEDERRLGLRMGVMFSLMKIYETERRFSGLDPEDAFALNRRSARPLPMGLTDFALRNGALESEFLGPIWADALTTPVAGPVAAEMLDRMDRDPGTIFRRLATMRDRQRDNRAAKAPKTPPAAPET